MAKFNFTDNKIRALEIKAKRYSVIDAKEDGLELFVYPKGTKTFCLYKRIDGVPKHKKLGNFGDITVAQAREIASHLKSVMYENVYLNSNDKLARITLNDVFSMYMNSKISLGQKTIAEYQRLWNAKIKNEVGYMRVMSISIETLEEYRNKNADTPYQTNRCLGLIKAVYNYLINKKSYNITNPANGVETFDESPCIRALDSEEIGRIVCAINKLLNLKFCLSYYAILCLLLIPVRKSALLSMRWQDLKLIKKTWIVPTTKNKKNLLVNLPNAIIPILQKLKSEAKLKQVDSEYVFYSKESQSGHLVDVKKAWNIVKREAQLEGRVRLHDFRHTFATMMAELTGNAYKIKIALGHNSLKSSEIYVNLVKEQISDNVNDTVDKMLENLPLRDLEKGTNARKDVKDMLILGAKPEVKLETPTKREFDKELEAMRKQGMLDKFEVR